MDLSRSRLRRGGGWTVAVALTGTLAVGVAGQLPAAADAPLGPLTAVVGALAPSGAPSSPASLPAPPDPVRAVPVVTASTSAGDRLPGALRAPATRPAGSVRTAAPVPAAAPAPVAAPAAPPVVRPPAPPATPSLCSGSGWQERRGRAALATLKGGAARTGFRVDFAGARKGYMGLTHLEERRIEVFVRPCGTQPDALLRHVIAHELGHAYDTTHLTDATRRAWKAARGIPAGADWYGCSGCTDFATPAGDFAEVYAQWARGASTNRSEIAGDVAPAQLAQLAGQFFGV